MIEIQLRDILPFFEKYSDEFINFYDTEIGQSAQEEITPCSCLEAFVKHKGIPFNMKAYMQEQSKHIREALTQLNIENKSEKERQLIVAKWIHNEAHLFREKVIEDQCQAIKTNLSKMSGDLPDCILEKLKQRF